MRIPFLSRKPEIRQAVYTDAIIQQILADARSTSDPSPLTSGPLEIAAGVISRAFASATIDGASIPPLQIASIARQLITRGEAVSIYNGIELTEIGNWTIEGNVSPSTWRYKVDLDSPNGHGTTTVEPYRRVVHARYSYDVPRPWIGVGPLQRAIVSGQLVANIENTLRNEAGGTVGYLLPIPTDGDDATVVKLKADINALKGRTAVVETTAAGWGEGRAAAPRQDYVPQRIGMNPPTTVPQIFAAVQSSILAICGVPIELVQIADGTGQREAWRRCLHGTIEPLARLIESELSRVYGRPVRMTFESLFASDIAGRARAFQSMVTGGMSIQDAANASGLVADDAER